MSLVEDDIVPVTHNIYRTCVDTYRELLFANFHQPDIEAAVEVATLDYLRYGTGVLASVDGEVVAMDPSGLYPLVEGGMVHCSMQPGGEYDQMIVVTEEGSQRVLTTRPPDQSTIELPNVRGSIVSVEPVSAEIYPIARGDAVQGSVFGESMLSGMVSAAREIDRRLTDVADVMHKSSHSPVFTNTDEVMMTDDELQARKQSGLLIPIGGTAQTVGWDSDTAGQREFIRDLRGLIFEVTGLSEAVLSGDIERGGSINSGTAIAMRFVRTIQVLDDIIGDFTPALEALGYGGFEWTHTFAELIGQANAMAEMQAQQETEEEEQEEEVDDA